MNLQNYYSCFDKSNSEIIITGDLNIDLLKINQRPIFSEFYDILTANSYLPKITLPTRFTETSGTLIDNFFCKLTNITIESVAGILTKKFSDHQPYFILLNAIIEKPHMPKYIKIRVQSEYAFNNFKKGVQSSNIYDSLDNNTGFLLRIALAGTMAFIAGTTCPDRITVRHIAMVLTVINVIDTQ